VSPLRRVQHLTDLRTDEINDLFLTVQRVSRTLKRVYSASAFNVAVQDGVAAGQSVPHVHAHVIPRHDADMDDRGGGDKLYELMEGEEGDVGKALREVEAGGERAYVRMPKVEEDQRKPRSMEEMQKEAEWLRGEMERDAADKEKGSSTGVV